MRAGLDFPGVTCVFVCHDDAGRIVLHQRSQHARDQRGCWDSGAGALEHGETFKEAVRREIREEYATEPRDIRLLGVRNILRPHDDGIAHWVAVMFAARVDPAHVRIAEPHKFDALGWFDPSGPLPTPLHPELHHVLTAYTTLAST
jgi:8-oxo-dGTP diphosphatase